MRYGLFSDFINSIDDESKMDSYEGDFFVYNDSKYWSGYFTSKSILKRRI